MSWYGKVGLDIGTIGRWARMLWGMLILIPIAIEVAGDIGSSWSPAFYGETALYLGGIAIVYSAVYYILGERFLSGANPWVNTLIFVGPALLTGWWNLAIAPPTGIELPSPLTLAMGVYIGASFLLQWKIRYGGCEVVSLPIILFKRRYVSYCIPLVAVDATEKKFLDTPQGTQRLLWGGLSAAVLLILLGWTVSNLMNLV